LGKANLSCVVWREFEALLESKIKAQFASLNTWSRGTERAPHKPLLVLLAIGRCVNENQRQIPFGEIDEPLTELLENFGPPRKSFHSEYPFWRLQNDGIWELENAENCEARKSNTDAKKTELRKYGVTGGFNNEIFEALGSNRELALEVARQILLSHFPDTFHEDLLESIGLDFDMVMSRRRKRDPQFREMILSAYEYKCAVCDYNIGLSGRPVGLEAAHIQWHQAKGPDTQQNGLALCVMHHKLFDRGAIGLSNEHHLLVSEKSHGNDSFDRWVLAFNGKPIRQPQALQHLPAQEFIAWHRKEVFRPPSRSVQVE